MTYRSVRTLLAASLAVGLAFSAGAAPGGGASSSHSALLMPDGTVWTSGFNYNGEVGDGTTQPRYSRVNVLPGATSIDVGSNHTVALVGSSAMVWGHNGYGQSCDPLATLGSYATPRGVPVTGLVGVAATHLSTFLLHGSGTVHSCGANHSGVLGDGSAPVWRNTAGPVANLTDAVAISGGGSHVLALRANGTVVGWGENSYGQLGDGSTTNRSTPIPVAGLTNVTTVSAGQIFSMALDTAAHVWVWGGNGSNGMTNGDGTTANHLTPYQVPGLTNIIQIAAGSTHAVALDANGQVWTWGGSGGGVADAPGGRNVAAVVAGLPPIAAIAAGYHHTYAYAQDGSLYGWGTNTSGQLGDGTTQSRFVPIVLADAGGVWRTGTPVFSPWDAPTYTADQMVQITSATSGATVRYTTNGANPTESDSIVPVGGLLVDQNRSFKARAWAAGRGPSSVAVATYKFQPTQLTVTPGSGLYTSPRTVAVSTTTPSTVIRYTTNGSEPTSSSPAYNGPISIATQTTLKAKAFRTGWNDGITLTATYSFNYGTIDAPVISPGGGTYSTDQTVSITAPNAPNGAVVRYTLTGGDPSSFSPAYSGPFTVATGQTVKARVFHADYTTSATTSATYAFTVATPTLTHGTGTYSAGQVVAISTSTPNATIRYTLTGVAPTANDPELVPGATLTLGDYTLKATAFKTGYTTSATATATYQVAGDVTQPRIAAGDTHTLAVKRDGTVWGFGSNGWGYLGDNSTAARSLPVRAAGVTGIKGAAAGSQHSLAVGLDGRVYSFGTNSSGQQGDGATNGYRTVPWPVPAVTNAVAVAAGTSHSLALTNAGQVYAWGANSNGQLGLGNTTLQPTPTLIPGLSDIAGIAAGDTHSLAWTTTGVLYAWGNNGNGRLGDNSQTQRTSPVVITGIGGVAEAAAGKYHSIARTTNGQVWTWGRNFDGALGLGNTTDRWVPTHVTALSGVQAIGAGHNHSLASDATTTYAWGANASSQVGNGLTANRTSPFATSVGASVQLAGGSAHSVALTSTGAVWTWGGNGSGQLGNGGTTTQTSPAPISGSGQTWGVSTPTASPGGGTKSNDQSVTLISLTPGATIRYTTNGTDPIDTDPIASGAISISQDTTLKAKAWKAPLTPSAVRTETYLFRPAEPTSTLTSGSYTGPQSVTLATTTADAKIRYTTDGTPPTATSQEYSVPLLIAESITLKAAAFKGTWPMSTVLTATFTIAETPPPAPTFTPTAGERAYGTPITIASAPNATIVYRIIGTAWANYTGPIVLASPMTVEAYAYRSGYQSDTSSASYTVRAGAPQFSPGPGTYSHGQDITITALPEGVTIRYTTNGQDPTAADPAVANGGSIEVGNFTLKARAFSATLPASDISVAAYQKAGDSCTYTFMPAGLTLSRGASGGMLTVTTSEPTCAWEAVADDPWITIDTASGTGSGQIPYHVTANPASTAREGTITVADQQIAVNQQSGAPCTISVSPGGIAATADATQGTLTVTASDPTCSWTAESNQTWLTTSGPGGGYPRAVLADGAIGYWRFNETAGVTTIADAVSPAHNGTLTGTLIQGVAGALSDGNRAAQFDGATAVVTIPNAPELSPARLTWEASVNIPATSAVARRVFGKGGANEAYALWIGANASAPTLVWTTTGGRETATLAENVVGAGWVHLAFTYDGQTWRAFVNGIQSQTGATPGFLLGNVEPIAIGSDGAGGSWFDGALDELTLYPYALSAEQLASHAALRSSAGVGSQVLTYNLTANTSGVLRQAALTVQDQALPVAQSAVGEIAITAVVSPTSNAVGWNRKNVVVSFICASFGTSVVSCPSAVPLTTDGIHEISRSATDDAGRSAVVSIVVRIDRGVPALTIVSPLPRALVQPGVVSVIGTILEAGSGIADVRCGQLAAVVDSSSFACEVLVPASGTSVEITATDLAGNQSNVEVSLEVADAGPAPSSLHVSPQTATMTVDEIRKISVHDDRGRVPDGVLWQVADPAVAQVSSRGVSYIRAMAPGTTTITASWRGLSATVDVTVLLPASVTDGTILWSLAPLDATISNSVRVDSPTGTRICLVDEGSATEAMDTVRCLTDGGAEEWRASAGGRVAQLSGTPLGGAAAMVRHSDGTSHVRVFRADGHYSDYDNVEGDGFAIHPDGPLYFASGGDLISVDIGLGGGHSARLPRGVIRQCAGGPADNPVGCVDVGEFYEAGTPSITWEGDVAIPVVTGRRTSVPVDDNPFAFQSVISVLLLRRDGTSVVRELVVGGYMSLAFVKAGKAVSNGGGGLLVTFDTVDYHADYARGNGHVGYIDSDGVAGGTIGIGDNIGELVVSADGALATGYLWNTGQQGGPRKRMLVPLNANGTLAGSFSWDRDVSTVFGTGDGFVVNWADGVVSGPVGTESLSLTNAMYFKDGKWFGNPSPATVNGQAAMTTSSMVMTKGPILSRGWPFPEKNGYGGANAPEPRLLTTNLLQELALRAGIDGGGAGILFNQRVGIAFQRAMTTSINLIGMPWWPNQNTTPHVSPARQYRTSGAISTVVPDVVADNLEVTDSLPRYFRSSTLIEIKAVKGRLTMGHSNHQTLGLIDATKRSPMGQYVNRMPWSANPALVFVTTGDTSISPRVVSCAFDRGVDLQRSYAYETYRDHIRTSWAESLTWDMEFRANGFKFPTEVFATYGRSVTLNSQLLLPALTDPDPAEFWPVVADDDPPYSPTLPACNVDWR